MKADGIFIKLMMLTTSSNDNEALIALRKANKILFDAKVNWEELLCAIQQSNEFRVPPSKRQHRPRPEPEWENVGGIKHTDADEIDRKSTRLNSSHQIISYAVFCLKKKTMYITTY